MIAIDDAIGISFTEKTAVVAQMASLHRVAVLQPVSLSNMKALSVPSTAPFLQVPLMEIHSKNSGLPSPYSPSASILLSAGKGLHRTSSSQPSEFLFSLPNTLKLQNRLPAHREPPMSLSASGVGCAHPHTLLFSDFKVKWLIIIFYRKENGPKMVPLV